MQQFGHRRHYCPNQPAMLAASDRIVRALAERFGPDPRVSAWQIDNELGGRCYCDTCRAAFQDWLERRSESLATLNDVWGTAFWSQTYDAWSQIPLPAVASAPSGPFGFSRNAPNPGLALDFRRFSSDSLIEFLKLQTKVLRETCDPRQLITHNLMGFGFSEIDYHALAEEVDIVSWDNYPILGTGRWVGPALSGDAMRGLKRKPVWVLEQQAGPLGWESFRSPRPGENRLYAWQAVAHGAEIVSFFRWRTARFGTEQHWHGIVDANGRLGSRRDEVRALADELAVVGDALAGAQPRADVAMLSDYDSRFALQVQPTNAALGYEATVCAHYAALRRLGLGVDVVSTQAPLDGYPIVVAPSLYVMDESLAATLTEYVRGGGVLVLAPRTAVKDRCNAIPERPQPAWLDALAGLEVTDYMSVDPDDRVAIAGENGAALAGALCGWYERVEPAAAATLAVYAEGPFAGTPAVTANLVGDGRAVYLAGVADKAALRHLYLLLADRVGLALRDLPTDVEAAALTGESSELLLLLNYSDEERVVDLGASDWRARIGVAAGGRIVLEPQGLALLETERAPQPAAPLADTLP